MFHFSGYALCIKCRAIQFYCIRFPHSEIPGSKVATHLPETYRRYAASFIASSCQGIHRTPLILHPLHETNNFYIVNFVQRIAGNRPSKCLLLILNIRRDNRWQISNISLPTYSVSKRRSFLSCARKIPPVAGHRNEINRPTISAWWSFLRSTSVRSIL